MNEKIQFHIKDGFDLMDFDKVTEMLKNAFWCPGIKKPEVVQGAKYSALVVGAFDKEDEQIGYARVISDRTRFGYVLDVMVDERYRKQGIGQAMVKYMMQHHDLKDVYQWLLITKDAHGVYKKVGFNLVSRPDDWMEIRNTRPER